MSQAQPSISLSEKNSASARLSVVPPPLPSQLRSTSPFSSSSSGRALHPRPSLQATALSMPFLPYSQEAKKRPFLSLHSSISCATTGITRNLESTSPRNTLPLERLLVPFSLGELFRESLTTGISTSGPSL